MIDVVFTESVVEDAACPWIKRRPQGDTHDTFLTGHEGLFKSNRFCAAVRDQVFVL